MNKVEDLTGQKFGRLTVIKRDPESNPKRCSRWVCKCDCGNTKSVYRDKLLSGNTTSCGCAKKHVHMRDLTGQRYGRLVALSRTEEKCGNSYIWKCQCDCGNTCYVPGISLTSLKKQSCGCSYIEKREEAVQSMTRSRSKFYVEQTDVISLLPKKIRANNTSGFTGVTFNKQSGTWRARICFQGKSYCLGSYPDKASAAEARREAESKIFGGFLEWYAEEFPEQWAKIQSSRSV